jgi:hypothetical protein
MSSSGITPINSGPLVLRTYLDSSANNTYAVGVYDDPVPENRVLITSTGGLVVPSDSISVSSITVSSLNASSIITNFISSVSGNISSLEVSSLFANNISTSNISSVTGTISSLVVTGTTNLIGQTTIGTEINTLQSIGYFESTMMQSSIMVGPPISPDVQCQNNNFSSALYVTTLANPSINVGSGIALGGRQLNDNTLTTFARIGGVGAGPIDGDMTFETLQQIGTTYSLIERMRIKNTGHIGIGMNNPSATLDIFGNINITNTSTYTFTTPGRYTLCVPNNALSADFEMVGAGGYDPAPFPSFNSAGIGGYIKGNFTIPPLVSTITIVVGDVGQILQPSGASYITVPNAGPLFVIAGAGGSRVFSLAGGEGGGGTFVGGIANGGNGNSSISPSAPGGGGSTVGGTAGTSCNPPYSPAQAGQGRPVTEDYEQALGGSSLSNLGIGPGGSGYTGGGSGCAGGGGSSYYDSSVTTIALSYGGNAFGPLALLPGYGRTNQSGYVTITFILNDNSLTANGNIIGSKLIATQGCINLSQSTNVTAATPGIIGDIRWDDDYIYVSTTVGWRKSQLVPV